MKIECPSSHLLRVLLLFNPSKFYHIVVDLSPRNICNYFHTFATVSSVSNKSRFACTVVRALSVITNGIYMTTVQAFLTFVDIYG